MRKSNLFKRVFTCMAVLGVLAGAASCGARNPYKDRSDTKVSSFEECPVEMTAKVTGNRKLDLILENKGPNTYMYGQLYTLEYKYGDDWYKVPLDIVFTMEGITLGPAEEFAEKNDGFELSPSGALPVDLSIAGNLPQGHYRMIKTISVMEDEGVGDTYTLAAEFDLEKESNKAPALQRSEIPEDKIVDPSYYQLPVSSVKKNGTKELTIVFKNYSAFGRFHLQYQQNGSWYDVPIRDTGGIISSTPVEDNELIIYTENPLSKGTYRILHETVTDAAKGTEGYYCYIFEL